MSQDFLDETEEVMNRAEALKKTLHAHWKKLSQEGLKVAKQKGLELIASDSPFMSRNSNQLVLYAEDVDNNPLIHLAKQRIPSTYHEYQKGLKKYQELFSDLQKRYKTLKQQPK
jgi:hypothetical protein